tara:strand:+ start:112 stop:480 length:369 start_codon:yes stop_codon:yes gene_type:complete
MKKLLITLLLISPFSFADWDDVYYCQETTSSKTTLEGERTDYKLEKFTFKLDKTKNAMVFGKDGYFTNFEMEVVEGRSWPQIEQWKANDETSILYYHVGKFLYVALSMPGPSISKSADCDKF